MGSWVWLEGPRGSSGRPTLQGPRRSRDKIQGPKWSRGRPTGSQGVKGWAYRVPGNQGSGLQGPSLFLLVHENEDDHLQQ